MSVKSEFVLERSLSFSEPGLLLVGGTEIDEYLYGTDICKKREEIWITAKFHQLLVPFPRQHLFERAPVHCFSYAL